MAVSADYLGVGDVFSAVRGDDIEVDGEEGVGASDASSGVVSVGADALAEAAHFDGG